MVFVRQRVVLLAVAVVVVVVVVLALTRVGGEPAADNRPITVDVLADSPGPSVPFGFLGLSLEYPSVESYAGTNPAALDPVFLQLVRNLVPGQAPVLRIGGDSADRTWSPTATLTRPPGIKYAITKRWLEVTRALAHSLNARLIVGLNLEADSPRLAAVEAGALLAGVGPSSIRAFELGNEPDLYATFPLYSTPDGRQVTGRPRSYDVASLVSDFTRFAAALPRRPLAGPSLGAPKWTRRLAYFLAAEPRVRLVTLHRYPLQLCYTSRRSPRYPTVAHLLTPAASIGLADSFAPYAATARAHGLNLRVDELNSVSCGADPSVSNTFASALWALDTLFEMVRVGVHGVNIHTFPGAGYELFQLRRVDGRWQATVAPEYYGLMLFARAAPAGARLERVDGAASGAVRTWATRGRDGTIRIVTVNSGSQARVLSLGVEGGMAGHAVLERLSAPSVDAHGGVTLAGQSFGASTSTGRLAARVRSSALPPIHGRYAVALPADSAALLVIAPAR